MDLFLRVNAVYGTFFGVSPPARACVGVDLPPGVRVKLECIAFAEHKIGDRQALHVQGLSYWAPANIGPYSQAITVSFDTNPTSTMCTYKQSRLENMFSSLVKLDSFLVNWLYHVLLH